MKEPHLWFLWFQEGIKGRFNILISFFQNLLSATKLHMQEFPMIQKQEKFPGNQTAHARKSSHYEQQTTKGENPR